MNRVVFKEMGEGGGVGEVVDGHQIEVGAVLAHDPVGDPPDTAEPVDRDAHVSPPGSCPSDAWSEPGSLSAGAASYRAYGSSARPKVTPTTRVAPACSSAPAAAASVAPVVATSSTSATVSCGAMRWWAWNAAWRLPRRAAKLDPTWGDVARTRSSAKARGRWPRRASATAKSSAWLKPRAR